MKYSVAGLHGIGEVQTKFHWQVEFITSNNAYFQAYDNILQARCVTTDLPKSTHEKIDVVAHGYTFPGPGIVKRNGTITMKFFENVDANVARFMYQWHDDIYNWNSDDVIGKQQVAHHDLFGDVKMQLWNKQETEVTQTYYLHKCIITELDVGGTLEDGNSPAYFEPVLTLEYAWFNWGAGASTTVDVAHGYSNQVTPTA